MEILRTVKQCKEKKYYGEIENMRNYIEIVMKRYEELKQEMPEDKGTAKSQLFVEDRLDKNKYEIITSMIQERQEQQRIVAYLKSNPYVLEKIYYNIVGKKENRRIDEQAFYGISMNQKAKEFIQNQLFFTPNDTLEQIKQRNLNVDERIGEVIKTHYIELLLEIGDFLKNYGLIEEYIDKNNKQMLKNDLKELLIIPEQTHIVYKVFDKEYLSTLDNKELLFLCTYFQNRVTKEKQDIYQAIYIIEQLNLWDTKEYRRKVIDQEDIKALLIKKEVLDELNKDYDENSNKTNYMRTLIKHRKEYKEVFDSLLPDLENDLAIDSFETATDLYHCKQNYKSKCDLVYQLMEVFKNDTKINWGYVPQSKFEQERYLLIGIDFPGYNFPVTFHMPKEEFISKMQEMGIYQINTYQGNDDIFIKENGAMFWEQKKIVTNCLYKVSKEQKDRIRQRAKTLPKQKEEFGLLHHINAMIHGIRLYHIKEKRKEKPIKEMVE